MEITTPSTDVADAIADRWVELARSQRAHESHVEPAENRTTARESILRRIVADEALVAREDGDVVGFVTFTTESGQYEQDVARGVVQNIYVAPEHRDRGVGGDLLASAERCLAQRGLERVSLEVMTANDDARRFYRRHGYDPHRVEFEKELESDTL